MAGGVGAGFSRAPKKSTTGEVAVKKKAGVQNATTRTAGTRAERENMLGDGAIDLVDPDLGRDDAPEIVDTWEFHDSGEVDPLVGIDPESDPPDYDAGWAARPSISIWPQGGGFDVTIDIPFHPDPAVEASVAYRSERLHAIAATLTRVQGSALRADSVVEAYLQLQPLTNKALEFNSMTGAVSGGQASRDRFTVIDTQFGVVPLWFFTGAPKRGALADLMWVAGRVVRGEPLTLVPVKEAALGRTLTTSPDQLARYARDMDAALRQRDVLDRYRALWPAFAREDYLDDLDLKPGRRSVPAAMLVLIGAIPVTLDSEGRE